MIRMHFNVDNWYMRYIVIRESIMMPIMLNERET